uniref:Uncharacterized protein n=1 Tax=Arundo donax TaxID=35708 RepID=A0A0A9CS74_ARUDO
MDFRRDSTSGSISVLRLITTSASEGKNAPSELPSPSPLIPINLPVRTTLLMSLRTTYPLPIFEGTTPSDMR